MTPLLVDGMLGLGDNVYQGPVIKELSKTHLVYLRTPWPQLYPFDNVLFVRPDTRLRTQRKNIQQLEDRSILSIYCEPPADCAHLRLSYVAHQRKGLPLYQGLVEGAGLREFQYHLKLRDACKDRKDYAVIRPVTIRREWLAPARNPRPAYIQFAIDHLTLKGIQTIVLADVDPPHEVYEGLRPQRATRYYEAGEFELEDMLNLIYKARIVIGGVGFIAPLGIALGTPTVIVHGGAGGFNAPEIINAPGEGKLVHVLPARYCRCVNHQHLCNKAIELPTLRRAITSCL